MFRKLMFCVLTGTAVALNAATGGRIISGVPYVTGGDKAQCGDIHLPEKVSPSTSVVLLIHGGGWTSMSRHDVVGIAGFFVDDLGFAVYNIDYRLASARNRWPACGDDCVTAAKWLLSPAFTEVSGIKAGKIWICGGSAGGHLALWTLVNMPAEKVAGTVSISSIGDPVPDSVVHAGRYRHLFGAKVAVADLAVMNPVLRIRPGTAPVLCTHATGDKVVPISSHRTFADAYRAAGNVCEFFEYPCDLHEGLTGHCIWIPGTKPRRLIGQIENRIRRFVGDSSSRGAVKERVREIPASSPPSQAATGSRPSSISRRCSNESRAFRRGIAGSEPETVRRFAVQKYYLCLFEHFSM